jgi:branched-chain amino acid transport system substrate-binding protein
MHLCFRKWGLFASSAVMVIALICGFGAGGASAASSSKAPIQIYNIETISSSIFGAPEEASAALAAAKYINATGGIQGHKIVVTTCNDQANPDVAATCAQKAVSLNVAAVVSGEALGDTGEVPILQQAGIPDLSEPTSPLDNSSPVSWPVDSGTAVEFTAMAMSAASTYHCKATDVIAASNTSAQEVVAFEAAGLKVYGQTIHQNIETPAVNTDYAPQAAEVASGKADCVLMDFPGTEALKAIPALRQGAPGVRLFANSEIVTPSVIKATGSKSKGIVVTSGIYPVNSSQPGVVAYRQNMAKYAKGVPIDSYSLDIWGQMIVLKQAINAVKGTINSKSVQAALGGLSQVQSTVSPVFSFTTKPPLSGFERIFNTIATVAVVGPSGYGVPSTINVEKGLANVTG